MKWIIKAFSQQKGIHYVRGNRKSVHTIYREDSTFSLGKGNLLQEGKDYLIVATGQLVFEALEVAKKLKQRGISSDVIDMFTIKPLDKALLLQRMASKKKIITIENHSIIGGLGSAVAEVIADHGLAIPIKRIGVDNEFGQVGTPAYLQATYGLTTEKILERIY